MGQDCTRTLPATCAKCCIRTSVAFLLSVRRKKKTCKLGKQLQRHTGQVQTNLTFWLLHSYVGECMHERLNKFTNSQLFTFKKKTNHTFNCSSFHTKKLWSQHKFLEHVLLFCLVTNVNQDGGLFTGLFFGFFRLFRAFCPYRKLPKQALLYHRYFDNARVMSGDTWMLATIVASVSLVSSWKCNATVSFQALSVFLGSSTYPL